MKKPLLRALQIAIAAAALGAIGYGMVPDPLLVETATATRGSLAVTVEGEGKTRVRERYVVAAPVTGQLARVEQDPGDPVASGATLVTITPNDPPLLDARSRAQAEASRRLAAAGRAQAKTRIEAAEAALEHARTQLGRDRALFEAGSLPRVEFEASELRARTASADADAARFAYRMAQSEVETADALLRPGSATALVPIVLRAPIDGVVLRVLRQDAGPVSAGQPLIEIGDPSSLEVVIDLLSIDAVAVPPGAPVELDGWGGEAPLEGHVRRVEPAAVTRVSALGVEEQRVDVIADITSPREQWRSLGDGYRVHARVTVRRNDDALCVPASALFRDANPATPGPGGPDASNVDAASVVATSVVERWAVFIVADGRARLRDVDLGDRSGDRAEIRAGLAEGERVITHPSDKLTDGARVALR